MSLNLNFENQTPNYDETFAGGGDYSPVPENWYTVLVKETSVRPTSKKNGHYIEFVYEIADGEFKGRKLWDRSNYDNPSTKAKEIAHKQLNNIAHACGVLQITEQTLPQFVGRMMDVHVHVVDATDQYKAKNEVDQYAPAGGATSSVTTTPAPAQGGTAPAWARK